MAVLTRNDPRQYDELVGEWERPGGAFAALHWLAAARASLIPPGRPGAVLLDAACGAGLMAPHVSGYQHVGVDLVASALRLARRRGVTVVQGDVTAMPFASESADVVVAGEILEHVVDLGGAVAEIARVLRPGGTVVIDTINDTWIARFSLVTVGERVPGGAPPRLHDPQLFVPPERLRALFAAQGVNLRVGGLRPVVGDFLRFLVDRRRPVRMTPTRTTAVLYQAVGRKRGQA